VLRTFRTADSVGPEPDELPADYKPKTMLEEYRVLAIVFGILFAALAVYFVKSVLRGPQRAPPPVQSVYIDVVPPKEQPPPAH
jgi:hypothetical protein